MTVDLTIDHIGSSGDGIAEKDGKRYYIPFTVPGDRVKASLVEEHGNGFLMAVEEIMTPGPDRTAPACRHFGTCGGCSLQHLDPTTTAAWKRQRIVDCLSMAGIEKAEVLKTISCPPGSRRRVEFIASKRKKGVMIGFHQRRSHQIFDVGDCPVIDPQLLGLVKPLRALLPSLLPRNSEARILATVTENGPDILITAKKELDLEVRETLANFATEQALARIAWRQNAKETPEVIAARLLAEVKLNNVPVTLPPGSFLQASKAGETALADFARSALGDARNIADLFAGVGSFTFPLAANAPVHAVEGDAELVNGLQNAANRAILPVTSETRDLFQRPLLTAELNSYDGLLFDPPRAGAKAQAEEIAKSNIPVVVAISCNPVTFARDVRILTDGGYRLDEVLPVDQFLFSPHIEMAAVLRQN
ncbi:23S rRNA (uracil(1939)-C(5))-methyltransferase RlmD [Sneathiella litorea]|uniref:23S rRNA (Uracil(1939)-C(5))-methyltransferase RlmD n=1 Tax=Sneathiella litorea TaxID=2606216 RepID=A0A6L8WAN9_9PROT|nr:23S rRNA (uracil(1939)-C(5))-methyltransferase RlmD [Sneathiella litorea]MZR32118.1 23S rRNA (uracil(1939)-C(5))-methyltransferase RlmD [Sneathiella litorea]